MAEKRRFYGGMKPVGRPKYETSESVNPPPKQEKAKVTKSKPLQKGTGEESVE